MFFLDIPACQGLRISPTSNFVRRASSRYQEISYLDEESIPREGSNLVRLADKANFSARYINSNFTIDVTSAAGLDGLDDFTRRVCYNYCHGITIVDI